MVTPAEYFGGIPSHYIETNTEEIPANEKIPPETVSGEIVVPHHMSGAIISGEIVIDDPEQLTEEETRRRIFECVGKLNSLEDSGFAEKLQKLIEKHPTNKELLPALEAELKITRNRIGTYLNPFQ